MIFKKNINFTNSLTALNSSKYMLGLMMLMLNVGSRYIELGFTKTQEQALRRGLGREILIFSTVFIGSRDVITSILMTAAFIILSDYVFNENSKFCVIPNKLKKIAEFIDSNNDNIISPEEEEKALETLRKADEQKKYMQQGILNSFLVNMRSGGASGKSIKSIINQNLQILKIFRNHKVNFSVFLFIISKIKNRSLQFFDN